MTQKFSLTRHVTQLYPGTIVSVLLALAASALARHYGAPVMLFALLLGMAVNFLGDDERCGPGIQFCARTMLRIGVALLGLRITAANLVDLGWQSALLVCVAVVLTTVFGVLLARSLRLGTEFGVLTGGSVAICGASAAIALATVLPGRKNADRELAFAIIGVTALSTIAMIAYPAIAGLFDLDDLAAGVFLGGTIHDVAQVVGAGYSISDPAGDVATLVKLLRVAMLAPIVFVVMVMFRKRATVNSGGTSFPAFLWVFIVLAAINSFGLIPTVAIDAGSTLSRWCLVVAISAVGMKTALREIAEVGWSPVLLMLAETVFIAVLVLGGYLFVQSATQGG